MNIRNEPFDSGINVLNYMKSLVTGVYLFESIFMAVCCLKR